MLRLKQIAGMQYSVRNRFITNVTIEFVYTVTLFYRYTNALQGSHGLVIHVCTRIKLKFSNIFF